ncbi:MAG TPA: serine/threonine-protein kinase [Gemmatimonadales bacterium]|nr:serine/threonine-protein kinase [Gemmatimonadales bacterium]
MASATRLCPSCNTQLPELATVCYVCGSATPPAIDKITGEFILPEGLAPTPDASAEMIRKLKDSLGKHYELNELIGRGGFAEVFRVRDLWLKRDLALKAIRPDLTVSGTMLARFRREAEAVAALRHPSIVPIYDIGEADGIMYILMPLIKGESLKGLLVRDGRRPINEARRILLEAAGALASAHEAGVVHRDIKPENIMLEGKSRRVLVMDFGIAKVMDAAGDSSLTSSGTIVGTPHYMSPEQASGDPHLDHRTDQYSLAVVGYHMLTGSVPFEGESTRAILFKQMMESPRSMRELVPEVPEALMQAVSKGMAKEPADRFPDIEAFSAAIEASAAIDSKATAAIAPVKPAKKPSRLPLMLAGAGLLTAVVVVAALMNRSPAAETVAGQPGVTGSTAAADTHAVNAAGALGTPGGGAPAVAPPPPPAPAPVEKKASETRKNPAGTPGSSPRTASSPAPATPALPTVTCVSAADGDDRDLAFRVCTSEAQTGNVVAQRRLAGLYDRSQVPGHDAEAVTWYRKAADAGDLPSLLRLGQLLHLGKGVPQNELDATAKIKTAAEADYVPAWTILAQRYEQGLGVRKSDKDASYWYRRAAEKGDVAAQAKVGDMYARGKGFDKDEVEAVTWFRKAAESGNREAQFGLGMAYLRGRGIQKSDSLGYEWLKKAAAQGHAEAQKEVAKRKT